MERGLEDMSSILKVEDLVKYYGDANSASSDHRFR